MSSAKLERLMNLMALLLDAPRPLRIEAIHQQIPGYPDDHDAFRRAFERDKQELREMGIPLTTEPVPGESTEVLGYRIPRERYALRDPGLTVDELAALHLAASAVQVEGLPARDGLLSLGGLVGEGAAAPGVEIGGPPVDPRVVSLFASVTEHTGVQLTYNGERRRIDPYRLEFQRGRWYLSGFDHLRAEERVYRVDRIEGEIERLEAGFEPPATAAPGAVRAPWELGDGERVTARVRIDAPQASWAVQHVGPAAVVVEHADGSVEVELPVTNREALRTFVLSFLDHAELLEPAELRADVVAWLADLAGVER